MRILFLSPQPFFQERGTPIAVRLALEVLSKRNCDTVDLLVYHEGVDVEFPRVSIARIPGFPFLSHVRPGISFKKVLCDFVFFLVALRMLIKNRKNQYHLIHAVEESVFMAYVFKKLFNIPYIYDMDSSLSMQLTEKWDFLKPLKPIFSFFERLAIRHSRAVVPVCDALAAVAENHGAPDMQIVRDISLLTEQSLETNTNLREVLSLNQENELVLYIGNLESYQGIDLLLESFQRVTLLNESAHLVIVGGNERHLKVYRKKVAALGIANRAHLIGPRPVNELRGMLLQADILTSPRTKGENTPMKIYSYLHSSRAIVATNLPTNTQVLDQQTSVLCEPTPEDFAAGILKLISDKALRASIASEAFQRAEEKYTFDVFSRSLNDLYDRITR